MRIYLTCAYFITTTITTVGYGDISPHSPLGQFIASIVMILGYGIIAVPTGIFAAELNKESKRNRKLSRLCQTCNLRGHTKSAIYCRRCGEEL